MISELHFANQLQWTGTVWSWSKCFHHDEKGCLHDLPPRARWCNHRHALIAQPSLLTEHGHIHSTTHLQNLTPTYNLTKPFSDPGFMVEYVTKLQVLNGIFVFRGEDLVEKCNDFESVINDTVTWQFPVTTRQIPQSKSVTKQVIINIMQLWVGSELFLVILTVLWHKKVCIIFSWCHWVCYFTIIVKLFKLWGVKWLFTCNTVLCWLQHYE